MTSSPATTPPSRPLGRRPGSGSSRAAVLAAATALFAREGYGASTVRAIAAEAGVDSALVVRFFGGKEALFAAVLDGLQERLPALLAATNDVEQERRGRLLAESYFSLWESPETGEAAQALVRGAIGSPGATEIMQRFLQSTFFAAAPRVDLAAVSSTLLGVAITRYIVRVGPFAEMPLERVVDVIAPSLQVQLDAATA